MRPRKGDDTLDVKTPIKSATTYMTEVFPDAKDIRLEEVQLSDDERFWQVTFSYLPPGLPSLAEGLQAITGACSHEQPVRSG